MVEELLHSFRCLERNSAFATTRVKGQSKHVSPRHVAQSHLLPPSRNTRQSKLYGRMPQCPLWASIRGHLLQPFSVVTTAGARSCNSSRKGSAKESSAPPSRPSRNQANLSERSAVALAFTHRLALALYFLVLAMTSPSQFGSSLGHWGLGWGYPPPGRIHARGQPERTWRFHCVIDD